MTKIHPEQLRIDYETTRNLDALSPEEHVVDFLNYYNFPDPEALLALASYNTRMSRASMSYVRGAPRSTREIDMPNPIMRVLHHDILRKALPGAHKHISPHAYGIESRQIPEMIEQHIGHDHFFKLDLSSAYQSVQLDWLAELLASISSMQPEAWRGIAERFFKSPSHPGLATGGNASPLLFNLYMAPLDEVLSQYSDEMGLTYTRYMDDLVFSSDQNIGYRKAYSLKAYIRDYGFTVNPAKVRRTQLSEGDPIIITGIQINPGGTWQLANRDLSNCVDFYREMLDLLHNSGLDVEEMGIVRGIHGYLKQCTSQQRVLKPKEDKVLGLYHELETRYRQMYPDRP